jgi:hypothetical protein
MPKISPNPTRIKNPARLAELRELNKYHGQPDRCAACGSPKRPRCLCCIVCGNANKTLRTDVYDAVDRERDYQDAVHDNHQHSLLEWIIIIESYVTNAKHCFMAGGGNDSERDILCAVRKIAGTAVACMEQCGVVTRDDEDGNESESEDAELLEKSSAFRKEIESAINRFSKENGSNTPDFILAQYLVDCLGAYDKAVTAREKWYGREPKPVDGPTPPPGFITNSLTDPGERCTNPPTRRPPLRAQK